MFSLECFFQIFPVACNKFSGGNGEPNERFSDTKWQCPPVNLLFLSPKAAQAIDSRETKWLLLFSNKSAIVAEWELCLLQGFFYGSLCHPSRQPCRQPRKASTSIHSFGCYFVQVLGLTSASCYIILDIFYFCTVFIHIYSSVSLVGCFILPPTCLTYLLT